MKKIILFAALLFSGYSVAQAQVPVQATTELNVILTPIQTITVNTASNNVNLEYATATEYKDGVSSNALEDHLSIISTGAFNVTVKAANLTVDGSGTGKEMAASSIKIKADKGTTNKMAKATLKSFALSTGEQELISSLTGGTNKTFDVTFTGAKNDLYADNYIVNNALTTYTTTVTYTLSPK